MFGVDGDGDEVADDVADDVAVVRNVVKRQLHNMGYSNVDLVSDGSEAVMSAQTALKKGSPFDVVIMDFHMPNVDGIAATRTIMEECGARHPVVLGLTADVTGNVEQKFKAAGAVTVLHKPLDESKLQEALNLANKKNV